MFLGTDRNLLSAGTGVYERFARLGKAFPDDSFVSIIFAARTLAVASSAPAENVHAHSTRSFSRFLYGFDAIRIAKRLARPDVVSAQDPFETGMAALFISRLLRVPLVVEMHTDFLAPAYARHSLVNRLRVALASLVIPHAAGAYTVSARLRNSVIQTYGLTVPVAVLPIYVDIKSFEVPHIEQDTKTGLLWIGRLEKEKNPGAALEAVRVALDAGFPLTLTIIGSGSLERALKKQVETLDIEHAVTFAGAQSDVRPYLARANLLLCTSTYEGYGMVTIEALAAGVPVLSTEVGIAREAGALIVEGDYPSALCHWLEGPRVPGTLTLSPYKDEQDYRMQVRALYGSVMKGS